MTNEEKHIEILAEAMQLDSEDKELFKENQDFYSVNPTEALTALSLLQEECDKEKADLNEQIEWYKESIDHYNADEKEYEATIASLRAELEAVKLDVLPLTESDNEALKRLLHLHFKITKSSGLTDDEDNEYEDLKEELASILPF